MKSFKNPATVTTGHFGKYRKRSPVLAASANQIFESSIRKPQMGLQESELSRTNLERFTQDRYKSNSLAGLQARSEYTGLSGYAASAKK